VSKTLRRPVEQRDMVDSGEYILSRDKPQQAYERSRRDGVPRHMRWKEEFDALCGKVFSVLLLSTIADSNFKTKEVETSSQSVAV
jgi:hypothetical protein